MKFKHAYICIKLNQSFFVAYIIIQVQCAVKCCIATVQEYVQFKEILR